ncbi:TetR/AcrR family transcriptional regulator [Uniformispora flossi]|uniref:TetR/AcrR family transcriptional regulator n=1 Tax=Uniformispora flossi TaxID=3390723 RepID=UPI003C2D631B
MLDEHVLPDQGMAEGTGPMTQQSDGIPRRGRGRPRRLSRELIVEAAAGLVRADAQASLTIKSVADAVGSAPMALYRYFPDRDDLLHAVAERLTEDLEVSITTLSGDTWQEQLREWMVRSMESLRPYPQLLPYIVSTRQPSWLPSFVILTKVLEPLRLSAEDQALAVALVGTTIVGQASMAAVRRPPTETVTVLQAALDAAGDHDAAERAKIGGIVDELPSAFDRLYDTVIDSTIAAIEALGGRSGPRRSRRARKGSPMSPLFSNPDPW